jgi:hypothetical protein
MIKRISLLAMLGALALLLGALPAPVQADHHTGLHMRSDDAEMAKLSGCLNPGAGEGWYTLTTEDGKEVAVMGGEDVGAHAQNHRVELTGKWVGDDDHKHFEASGVEHKGICE